MRWFARHGLRVLMYHRVAPSGGDALTVTRAQLEWQLDWLRGQGSMFVTLAQTVAAAESGWSGLPANPVLVTFDDAYLDTWELARPALAARGIPAVVFVPTSFVGGISAWESRPAPLMDAAKLRALAAEGWELGLHSHAHRDFRKEPAGGIRDDMRRCAEEFARLGLPAAPGFAFPYGGRPRGAEERAALREAFREAGVRMAFRIGNRVNCMPGADPLELNRIGPRGDRGRWHFQRHVWWGRLP